MHGLTNLKTQKKTVYYSAQIEKSRDTSATHFFSSCPTICNSPETVQSVRHSVMSRDDAWIDSGGGHSDHLLLIVT